MMFKKSKLAVVVTMAVVWFFTTVLFILYTLSHPGNLQFNDGDVQKRNMLLHNSSLERKNRSSSKAPTILKRNVFSYEKYSLGTVKRKRLNSLLKKMMLMYPRVSDSYYSYNLTLGDQIPVIRKVPDNRPDECKNIKFNYSSFPTVSVISPFHNEALTSVVRHVHAILSRTPPFLLRDIILVDDNSTFEYLGRDLEEYFRILDPKIKIIRNIERKGLIVSRLRGADYARGEVIIFMDAHMEACEGWIEPLLERINTFPAIVVQPDVIPIEENTFKINTGSFVGYRGGFGWDLRYPWLKLPDYLHQVPRSDWGPVPFPCLQGSCIAIRKSYYKSIGGFDPGLKIWGGEHFEMSFNVWMTGGRVEAIPCSKVGHIFKTLKKYSFGAAGKYYVMVKNHLRVAEVWMDEYKKIVRAAAKSWHNPLPVLNEADWKSIEERRQLRKRRKSKSFDWFLKSVMPELKIPEETDLFFGEVMNAQTKECLDLMEDGFIGMTKTCGQYLITPDKTFALDKFGRLKHEAKCVMIDETTRLLRLQECPGIVQNRTQPHWSVDGVHLVFHDQFGSQCATLATSGFPVHRGEPVVQVQLCDGSRHEQNWYFKYQLRFD